MSTRREFITLLGGAAVAVPLAARAQQPERVRRIGVLMYPARDDPEGQARIAAFLDSLQQLGWTDGRNVRIDIRWPAGFGADRVREDASELVAAAPDVILATGNTTTAPLQQLTRTVPIVFVVTADPVSEGYVASMARPGGMSPIAQRQRAALLRIDIAQAFIEQCNAVAEAWQAPAPRRRQ